MERAVTPHEAAVVKRLLDHAAMCDVTAYRQGPVDDLRVIAGCDCGCFSLKFAPPQAGARMLADALAAYPDGQLTNLILWGRDGEVTWLEVDDVDPRVPHRFPEMPDLRTWEERGQTQP